MERMIETFKKEKASIMAEADRRVEEEKNRESTFGLYCKALGGGIACAATLGLHKGIRDFTGRAANEWSARIEKN